VEREGGEGREKGEGREGEGGGKEEGTVPLVFDLRGVVSVQGVGLEIAGRKQKEKRGSVRGGRA